MSRLTLDEYRAELRKMANADLVDETASAVLDAAIMSGFRCNDGWHDDRADACYDEAGRRGNSDLYQRGYNQAVRSQGHESLVRAVEMPIAVGDPTLGASA